MIQFEESLQSTIKKIQYPARIYRAPSAAQHRIARDCDPRFQGR
jgi:hypothetical protein